MVPDATGIGASVLKGDRRQSNLHAEVTEDHVPAGGKICIPRPDSQLYYLPVASVTLSVKWGLARGGGEERHG